VNSSLDLFAESQSTPAAMQGFAAARVVQDVFRDETPELAPKVVPHNQCSAAVMNVEDPVVSPLWIRGATEQRRDEYGRR
jgi:hypothetical protein